MSFDGLTEAKLAELFDALKNEPADSKGCKKDDISSIFWGYSVKQANREPLAKKFVELGGPQHIEELLLSDDFVNVEAALNLLGDAFYYVYPTELAIEIGTNEKLADRFAGLIGKLGDRSIASGAAVRLQMFVLNVTMSLTQPREVHSTLADKFVPVLVSEHLSVDSDYKLQAYCTLANLIGGSRKPEDIATLAKYESVLNNLTYSLSHEATREKSSYYQVKDLIDFILYMTEVEENRQMLFRCDLINELVETLKNEQRVCGPREALKCLQLLTTLSFDKTLADSFLKAGIIAVLEDLKSFKTNTPEVIDAIGRALWVLQSKQSCNSAATPKLRVLLSFSCHQRDVAERFKDHLLKHDFDVITKGEHNEGHTLQASIDAVDEADAAILCVSDEYKYCVNCRVEAEYVSSSKPFVVAAAVSGYKPSGWLASLAAGSGSGCRSGCECEFELDTSDADKLAETAKRVADAVRQAAEADWKEPAKWDSGKVGRWLRKNGFEDAATAFEAEGIDGAALQALSEGESKYFEETAKSFGIRKIGKVLQLRSKLIDLCKR